MKTKQAYCVINGVSGLVSFISCHGQQLRLDSVLGFHKNARDFGNTILTGSWISHFPFGWTAFYEGSTGTPHTLASRGLAQYKSDWKLNEHYSCEFYLFGPTEHAHFPGNTYDENTNYRPLSYLTRLLLYRHCETGSCCVSQAGPSSPSLGRSASCWGDRVVSEWRWSHIYTSTLANWGPNLIPNRLDYRETIVRLSLTMGIYGTMNSGITSQDTFISHWQCSQEYYWMEHLLKQAVMLSSINHDKINFILGFIDN